MAGDSRDDDGRYTQEYSDESFLSAIDEVNVASTQSIADEVGCSYDLAYRRLSDLRQSGVVDAREVRGAFVWVRPD
jgi:hypothetical protein